MMSETQAMQQLPRYQCHKKVWALKIKEVLGPFGAIRLVFEDEDFSPITPTLDYLRKHNPQAGGYFVRYDDGYESYSPAEAFEDGYTLLN